MRLNPVSLAFACIFLAVGPLVADERAKVPDAKDQEKAEAVIKDLFKAEYSKTKAADKLELATKLFEQGVETKDDPASRFVLLRESMNLAAAAGDLTQALKAGDELSHDFEVNVAELKVGVFEKLAPAVKGADENKSLTDDILTAVNEAIQADDFDTAERLLKVADASARKSKNLALVSTVSARGKDVTRLRSEFARVKEALAALDKKPNDAEANSVAGKYFCFVKGNWDKGLVMLAQGKDAKLKQLAEKDSATPEKPAEQMELAEAWYDLATSPDTDSSSKIQLQLRALNWYEQAVGGLTGLTKTKAEKRIAELDKVAEKYRDRGELFGAIKAALKEKKNKNTTIVGFAFGKEFAEAPPEGAILVGFELGKGKFVNKDVVASLRPIYLTSRGEKLGEQLGKAPDKVITIKAKPGYAVGLLNLQTGLGIDGLSVTFMRLEKTGLKKDDKYDSEYIGSGKGKGQVDAMGALPVGICGRKNDDGGVAAIGLVTVPGEEKKK